MPPGVGGDDQTLVVGGLASLTSEGEETDSARPEPSESPLPSRLGRFEIERRLGAGGMSVVYLAHDPKLDRAVAIKVVSPKRRSSDSKSRERLLREAQALARLSHPNVVQIFEVGELEGQVYIAMELVEGRTLRRWWRESDPSVAGVLGVMQQVATALQAAHQVGLCHRDVKPENILVGDDGRVVLVDFGLARPSDSSVSGSSSAMSVDTMGELSSAFDSPITEYGTLIGTPRYMAPELMDGGHPTPASDQFAYCLTLYEALYRERPFAGKSIREYMANVVAQRIVPAPANSTVPGWLRGAVLRGLRLDAGDRHASMRHTAAALSLVARRRRRQRHALLGIGTLAAAAAIVALRTPTDAPVSCPSGEEKIDTAYDGGTRDAILAAFAQSDRGFAAAAGARAIEALDLQRVAWLESYASVCETRQAGGDAEAETDRRMLCLERRLDEIASVALVLASADENTLERSPSLLSRMSPVEECDEGNADEGSRPVPADPDTRERVLAERRRLSQAAALTTAGRYDEARRVADQVLAAAREIDYGPLLAESLYRLAALQDRQGELEAAAASYEDAALAAEASRHDRIAARALIDVVQLLGARLRRFDEAEEMAGRADAILKRIGDDPLLRAYLHGNRGGMLNARGDFEEALAEHRESLRLREEHLGLDSAEIAPTLNSIGLVLARSGRVKESEPYLERALQLLESHYGKDHPVVGAMLNNLGNVYERTDELERALPMRERALAIMLANYTKNSPRLATGHTGMAKTLIALGRAEEALGHADAAIEARRISLGEEHPEFATALQFKAQALHELGRTREALPLQERAVRVTETSLGEEHPSLSNTLLALATILRDLKRYEDALTAARRALATAQRAHGMGHRKTAGAYASLGQTLLAAGRPEPAIEELRRAREVIARELPGEVGKLETHLARAYAAAGDADASREHAAAARTLFVEAGGSFDDERAALDELVADLP